MNWLALTAVLVLAVGAAVVWLALAARLVANEEKAKEQAEAERRRLDLLREASEQEHRQEEVLQRPAPRPFPGTARAGPRGPGQSGK